MRSMWDAALRSLLIAAPEYNYSMPGVLKLAIDAASRPYGHNPFDGNPVAIMGASIGMLDTARAQYHLRQTMVFLNMHPLNQPEIMVALADKTFDRDRNLTDEMAGKLVKKLLVKLVAWTRQLGSST